MIYGKINALTTDKYLSKIRLQISELISEKSKVLELGCGNGDLLFKLSNKISYGLGVDNSNALIKYASREARNRKLNNLFFKTTNLENKWNIESHFDYAIASLFLHVIPWESSLIILNKMLKTADTIIICTFVSPQTKKDKILLELDQFFSFHYLSFKRFLKNDGVRGLLKDLNVPDSHVSSYKTFDNSINIFQITNTN